jgi:hypothetical protein
MESWGAEMPTPALDVLHTDLQAARSDAAKGHGSAKHEPAEAVSSEHPAAS